MTSEPGFATPTESPNESFVSILFDYTEESTETSGLGNPAILADLQLNQIISAVTAGREEYDLVPLYHRPLRTLEGIDYRHQVIADLEKSGFRNIIEPFSNDLREMRRHLADASKLRYLHQREAVFAVAVELYCGAVESLRGDLDAAEPSSPGFSALRDYLHGYADSGAFRTLGAGAGAVLKALTELRYCVRIKGSRVTVSRYDGQADHAAQVQEIFKRFRQGALRDHADMSRMLVGMDHVEAMILERVARLFPDVFASLDRLFQEHQDFADQTVLRFDREIQFYLAHLDNTAALADAGLHFCLPSVSSSKDLCVENTFDLALAQALVPKHRPVVPNDFRLRVPERILVVSGPNQGGKTTFARTVGQLHYLAALGLSVPGTRAELFLPDKIFTHFERGENTRDMRGKLMDDLVRIHDIIEEATPASLIILNEIFTSTTLADAIDLGGKVLDKLTDMGVVCVCVTFVDELASLNRATVSMVSTVEANNPEQRTFKILRGPADGLAYAMALARKYRLTRDQLKKRIIP